MNTERQSGPATSTTPPRDESIKETLTDLIDRLDREAFERLLELRDLRVQRHAYPRR
jgi:hypothetical protein